MSRDRYSPKTKTRPAARRKKTSSTRRGARAGATRRRSQRRYDYTVSALLPRLRRQALDLNASRVTALLLAGVMIAFLVWFFVDESFYVYAAQVRGNSLVTADEVYQAGGLDMMSIFFLDPRQVAQDIDRALHGVTQVRVQLQLPGRVSVDIREQDVRYLWHTLGSAFLVDGEGHILKEDDGTHAGLLVVRDLDDQEVHPGDQVDCTALVAAGRLHSLLPEVQMFEYSRARGVSVSDARGWRVYFGDDQRLEEKVATLQALLVKLAQQQKSVQVIDLRFVESPYYQ